MSITMNGAYFNNLDQAGVLEKTRERISGSSTTDYLLFSLNVSSETSADINFGLSGPILASNGQLTKDAVLLTDIVKEGVATGRCQRVWLSLGGWGSSAFTNIQKIVQARGALPAALMSNFQVLIQALRAIPGVQSVGFDMDYEEQGTAFGSLVADVSVALYEQFKCPITFCPYQPCAQWIQALQSIYARLKTQPVVGINLQCYAGGGNNDPSQWTSALQAATGTGVTDPSSFVWPILSFDPDARPTHTPADMTGWLQTRNSRGASLWATASLTPEGPSLATYAQALATGIGG